MYFFTCVFLSWLFFGELTTSCASWKRYSTCFKRFRIQWDERASVTLHCPEKLAVGSSFSWSSSVWSSRSCSSGLGAGAWGVSPDFKQLCRWAALHFAYLSNGRGKRQPSQQQRWNSSCMFPLLFLLGEVFTQFAKGGAHVQQHAGRVKGFDNVSGRYQSRLRISSITSWFLFDYLL